MRKLHGAMKNSAVEFVFLLIGQHFFEGVDRTQSLGGPSFLRNSGHWLW